MAPKAASKKDPTPPVLDIAPKKRTDWNSLLQKARDDAWRKLLVTIQIREKIHAGKPVNLNAANAMLKARGLEDQIEPLPEDPEKRAEVAEVVVDEGLCAFVRREGRPGIWFPSNHIKAGLKENLSVLGITKAVRGSRGAMAEGVFVFGVTKPEDPSIERDYVFLGEQPDGVDQSVTHSMTPKGPIAAIKRNEFVLRPRIAFEVWIAADKRANTQVLSDEDLAKVLIHFGEHGLGANRSQGVGKFDVVSVTELNQKPEEAAA